MKQPFDLNGPHLPEAYSIRLNNAITDGMVVDASPTVLVLDAYVLYCRFIFDVDEDLQHWCACQIYESDLFELAVLPETLWEMKQGLEEALGQLVSEHSLPKLREFLAGEEVRRFVALMEQEGNRQWDEILKLLVSMVEDEKTRAHVRTLFQYETLRRVERPLAALAADLQSGRLLRMADLCARFGAERLEIDEEARRQTYSTLAAFRGRHSSDVVDSVVYARCRYLNDVAARNDRRYRCRFLSHENMVDMLEHVDLAAEGGSLVRSFTDTMLIRALAQDRVTRPEIKKLAVTAKKLRRSSEEVRSSRSTETYLHEQEFRAELRRLRQRVLAGAPRLNGVGRVNFLELATRRIRGFFDAVREVEGDNLLSDQRTARYKKEVTALYDAVNNLRNREESLEDFMAPIFRANWVVWSHGGGKAEDLLEFSLEYLVDAASDEDVEELIREMQIYQVDFREAVTRVRAALPEASVAQLPVLVQFLERAERIVERQSRSFRRRLGVIREEIRDVIQRISVPEADPKLLNELIGLVEEDTSRETCELASELIGKRLEERPGTNTKLLSEALIYVEEVRSWPRDMV